MLAHKTKNTTVFLHPCSVEEYKDRKHRTQYIMYKPSHEEIFSNNLFHEANKSQTIEQVNLKKTVVILYFFQLHSDQIQTYYYSFLRLRQYDLKNIHF